MPQTTPGAGEPGPVAPHGFLYYLFPAAIQENRYLSAGLTLVIWVGLAALAAWLLFVVLRNLVGRTHTGADDVILSTVRVPLFSAITAYGFLSALAELSINLTVSDTLNRLYLVVIYAAGFYFAWRIIKEVLIKWLASRAKESEQRFDDTIVGLVNTFGAFVLSIVALGLILQTLGVDVGVLIASIGAVGLIVGLAIQPNLSNIFSGLSLMLDATFQENDLIVLPDGKVCRVQRIGLRSSQLYDMNSHALVHVPNNTLTATSIVNITKPSVDMKVASSLTVAGSRDPDATAGQLVEILQSHRNILGRPSEKLLVLRRRLAALAAGLPEAAALEAALAALDDWEQDTSDQVGATRSQLTAVRREMNARLREAETAVRALPPNGATEATRRDLLLVLGGGLAPDDNDALTFPGERMKRLEAGSARLAAAYPATALAPLRNAVGTLNTLDAQENALEATLEQHDQAREVALDGLLQQVMAAGEAVAAALAGAGRKEDAAYTRRWTRTAAAVQAQRAVDEAVAGLDSELGELIAWLGELEEGGLDRAERVRIRDLFGPWGGMQVLARRHLAELRRRIIRWLEWKEQDTLSPDEYKELAAYWDRRLRQLTRRLRALSGGDEEALDSRLMIVRDWLHSSNFWEQLPDWKLPGAEMCSFNEGGMDFSYTFYVDDIKQEHFSRQGRVAADFLHDLYDTAQRIEARAGQEGAKAPVFTLRLPGGLVQL